MNRTIHDIVVGQDPDRRIHMFLDLTDPDPDPLVRCTDPSTDVDPLIIKRKY